MLAAVVVLGLLVLALLVGRERDARTLERLLAATARERQSLLDRIQHPERTQVTPVDREPSEPPRDGQELAHVGGIVPDGVTVGGDTSG